MAPLAPVAGLETSSSLSLSHCNHYHRNSVGYFNVNHNWDNRAHLPAHIRNPALPAPRPDRDAERVATMRERAMKTQM